MPFVVSEGDFVNIGSQLILTDVDSSNSLVYVDHVYIEVVGGTSAERLFFDDDLLANVSLDLQPNYNYTVSKDNSL